MPSTALSPTPSARMPHTFLPCKNKKQLFKNLSYPQDFYAIQRLHNTKMHLSTIFKWISGKLNVRLLHFSCFFALFRLKTTGCPQENSGKALFTIDHVENLSTFSTLFSHKNCNFSKNFTILWKRPKNYPQFRKNRCGKPYFIHIVHKSYPLYIQYK